MKVEKKQLRPHITSRIELRYLLLVLHRPLFVTTGFRNWNKKIVPVGSSFMRLPIPPVPRFFMVLVVAGVVVSVFKVECDAIVSFPFF